MKLEKFKYKNETREWKIDELELNSINLIVGQNATGKTRVIDAIKNLSELICGKPLSSKVEESYEVSLTENGDSYRYLLKVKGQHILEERLEEINFEKNNGRRDEVDKTNEIDRINKTEKKELLIRKENGEGTIYSQKDEKNLEFGIQENQLAIVFKNDKIHHKFVEKIVSWAEKTLFYSFGTNLGKYNYYSMNEIGEDYSLKDTEKLVKNYIKAREKYEDILDEKIKDDLKNIGYDISSIGVEKGTSNQGEVKFLSIQESDLKRKTFQFDMSQGMFRALSIIMQLNICLLDNDGELIVVDDIGEGLDYERSTKLIKLIIQKTKESKIQVIMTTNDRFIMNNVDIAYWQVVQRDSGNIRFFNKKNSRDIFEDFEYTGLSNFDFLSRKLYLGVENE